MLNLKRISLRGAKRRSVIPAEAGIHRTMDSRFCGNDTISLFRIAIAGLVAFHMLPSLLFFKENYLQGAFRFQETGFFPEWFLGLANQSPDGFLIIVLGFLIISWFSFILGFKTQISAIVLTLCVYFLYARNAFYLKTLAWDMLLVTLVLISALWANPLMLRRLLMLQFCFIYFYAALNKIIPGNWLRENPLYYLMHYPDQSVMRFDAIKNLLGSSPQLCYILGLFLVAIEFLLPILLLIPKTRILGIAVGIFFHLILSLILHVPLLFILLFLTYSLLFLFHNEEKIILLRS